MQLREYGKTGKKVSALGMGCMRFERVKDREAMAEVVKHAFDRGINYFDTAPGYFAGKSEQIVGLAVKEMKKSGKPLFISTKTFASEESEIRQELDTSLKRLNVDAIDFYHVWCLVHPDSLAKRKRDGILDTFRKLKEEGLIRHICVSTHLTHDLVEPMLDEGEGLFEGLLLGLNAINFQTRIAGVQAAGRRGMGVVTMNSLGGGLIPDNRDHFKYIMRPDDPSIIDAALRFNLSLEDVTVALTGFRNIADVDEAVDAVERFKPLGAEEVEAFKANVLECSDDFCTQCNYCKGCPSEINVLAFMEAYNHYLLNSEKLAKPVMQLKWHWGIDDIKETLSACTECGQCVEACTQHLPIMERFEHLRKIQEEFEAQQAAK